ncbi:hypothetical protein AAG570_000817 [Ranatra chinensis]|uniref:Serpin domain-containing protein n=1 Tax=Ranatra chinensis TaxID=642074 RepID=A0ABD0YY75_9HEMI
MLQLVHSRTENVAFSPYGLVSVALVLYEGTRGPTAAEIHATLKLPWNREVTRIGFRDLHRYLKSYFTNDGFLRGLVLSKPNVPLRQNYLRLLRFYGFYTNIMGASEQVTVTSSTTKQTTTTPVPPGEVPEERTTTETEAPTVLTTTTQLPTTTVVVPVTEPLEVTTTETVLTMTSAPGNIPEVMSQVNESALSSEGGTDHVVSIVPITGLEEKPDSTTETPAAVIGEETTLVTQISGEPTSTPNLAITEVKEQEAAPGSQQQVTATDDGETIGTPAHLAATTTPLPTSVLTSQNPSASTAQESQEVTQSTAFISTEETTSSTLAVESISTMASATSAPSSQTAIFSEMSTIQQTGTSASESYTSTLPTMPSPGVVEPENVPATVATSPTTGVTSGEPPMTEPSSTFTPAAVVVPQSETNTDPVTGTPPENESTVPFSSSSPTTSQENVPNGTTIAVGDSIDSGGEQEASHQEWFFTMSGAGESVPVLTYTAYLPFAHLPEVTSLALQIPLDDPRYAMLILLPEERMGLEEVLYSLQWCQLSNILSRLKTTPVYAVIPSFTTVKHVNLTPALAQLGVRRIFDPYRADLSEMATEPHVFVRTIEQVVTVSLRKYYHNHRWFDARPHEIRNHFIADHPFAYFVLDKETGVALMAGTIVNPITKQTDAT